MWPWLPSAPNKDVAITRPAFKFLVSSRRSFLLLATRAGAPGSFSRRGNTYE